MILKKQTKEEKFRNVKTINKSLELEKQIEETASDPADRLH